MKKFCQLIAITLIGISTAYGSASQQSCHFIKPGSDVTAQLQQLIDTSSGKIILSDGTFRLTQTVVIDLSKRGFTSLYGNGTASFIMEGKGPAFKIIGTHTGTADPDSVSPEVFNKQRMPIIDGIEVVGAHPEATGIEITGTMQLIITKVMVRKALHGIHLTGRNRNVIISDSHLYHNTGVGVFYDNVDLHQSNITGCHISYNGGGGVVSRGGGVRNLQIGNCDIESNMDTNGLPAANIMLDSRGGSISEATIVGCTIQHTRLAPQSVNIHCIGSGSRNRTHWGHITIANNVFSDVVTQIYLQEARNIVISGNTFGIGLERDLVAEKCHTITMGANSFDRNPNYRSENNSKGGLIFKDTHNCTLTGLHVSGIYNQEAAIILDHCSGFTITGCSILDSDGAGILLNSTTSTLISGCRINDTRSDRNPLPSLQIIGNESGNHYKSNLLAHGLQKKSVNQ